MTDNRLSHKFTVGLVDGGKWLAVSSRSPYFAFEGESSEEVCAIANRALEYYFGVAGHIKDAGHKDRGKLISQFSPRKVIEKTEAA